MSSKTIVGVCNLCQEHKTLINSHIAPKWVIKQIDLLEGSHSHTANGINYGKCLNSKEGDTEPLFCSDCDNRILGQSENYAKGVLSPTENFNFHKKNVKTKISPDGHVALENINIAFLMFLYGLIYKTTVSSLPVCKNHNYSNPESLRQAILSEKVLPELKLLLSFKFFKLDKNYTPMPKAHVFINKYYSHKVPIYAPTWQINVNGWVFIFEECEPDKRTSEDEGLYTTLWDEENLTFFFHPVEFGGYRLEPRYSCIDGKELEVFWKKEIIFTEAGRLNLLTIKTINDLTKDMDPCPCGPIYNVPYSECCKKFFFSGI